MKKLISHILIALTGMLAVSCNAWLDVTPENAIADDDLFSTGFGYRNALNGIYTNLASDELYGKQLSWGFLSAISQQYNQKAGPSLRCMPTLPNLSITRSTPNPS